MSTRGIRLDNAKLIKELKMLIGVMDMKMEDFAKVIRVSRFTLRSFIHGRCRPTIKTLAKVEEFVDSERWRISQD